MTASNPLVSIVMAAYEPNPKHFIAALDSALSQTWQNLEVIVSDDSQTDVVRKIIYQQQDGRIRYSKNSIPLGAASNHWKAFKEARGEFISILNHDDLFDPRFVANLLTPLQAFPEAILAFCDHWIIDEHGKIETDASEHASQIYGRSSLSAGIHRPFASLLLNQSIPMAMGSLFRNSALPQDLPTLSGPAYDLWLTYYLSRSGGGAVYVPERLSSWRCHSKNITASSSLSWLLGSATCWSCVATDPLMLSYRKIAASKAAEGFLRCGLTSWRQKKLLTSLGFAIKSIKIKPNLRACGLLVMSFMPFLLIKKFFYFIRD